MPPVLGLVLIGVGLIAGIKVLQTAAARASEAMQQAAEAAQSRAERDDTAAGVTARDLGRLELDPATGVYKPRASSTESTP